MGRPALLAVEIVPVVTGRLSVGTATIVVVAVEAALALTALGQILGGIRRYRQERAAGTDPEDAFDAALRAVLPAPVAFVVRNEVRLLVSLVLAVQRRRHGVPPDGVPLGYDRALRPMALVLLGLAVVELVVIELALPWPTVRLVLLVLGAYTLLFVLGMIAANSVRPHVVTPNQLRLRSGIWADVRIPMDRIATVTTRHREAPNKTLAVVGDELTMGVAGMTNVEVRLAGPTLVDAGRRVHTVLTVRFAADDPQAALCAH